MKNLLKLGLILVAGIISCKNDFDSTTNESLSKDSVIFHQLMINGNLTTIKEADGLYYFSEDEILSERQFNLLKKLANNPQTIERSTILSDFTKKWPNGIWYYTIESNRTTDILEAMSWIEEKSNIQFVERTNQTNFVTLFDGNASQTSASNHIGMEAGNKSIRINPTAPIGTIVHEILHSLGFFHEQTRPDRNSFITVHSSNIDPDHSHNFNINPFSTGIGNFDYNSIMMYSSWAFSINGQRTITRNDNVDNGDIYSQRDYLSQGDIEGLAHLYGSKITGPEQVCSEEIYTISYGTLSLENASGIATLDSLGNNQWKVNRVGSASGLVKLKSIVNGQVSTKEINVGGHFKILGKPAVRTGETITYRVPNDIGLTNVTFEVGGANVLSTTPTSVKIKVYNQVGNSLPIVYIKATAQSVCGTIDVILEPTVISNLM